MSRSLDCKLCGATVHNCNTDCVEVTCWDCILEVLKPLEEPQKKRQSSAQGFPRGWRFMKEFVHQNGTVYYKGVEQPSLKGSLEPTKIEAKVKKSKAQKAQDKADMLKRYNELKKELKKETRKTAIKKIESQLKKLQKAI